jgi:hypothetical protein
LAADDEVTLAADDEVTGDVAQLVDIGSTNVSLGGGEQIIGSNGSGGIISDVTCANILSLAFLPANLCSTGI